MSSWVHVAGIIRIDSIRLSNKIPNFDELIGKECLWEAPMEVWDDCEAHPEKYLPMGSEGSLHKSVWVNPNISHMAAYTVSIFGDLRDTYIEDAEKIIEWFKKKCNDLCVRNAVITVQCWDKYITWTYGDD